MTMKNSCTDRREPPELPAIGTLFADRHNRVGEFRGVEYGFWFLRPVRGGVEWSVAPEDVRPANPEERMHAETARANARSRGELL